MQAYRSLHFDLYAPFSGQIGVCFYRLQSTQNEQFVIESHKLITFFPQIDNIFLLKYLGVSLKSSIFAAIFENQQNKINEINSINNLNSFKL